MSPHTAENCALLQRKENLSLSHSSWTLWPIFGRRVGCWKKNTQWHILPSLSFHLYFSLCVFFSTLFIYYKKNSFLSSPTSICPLFFWDMSHITWVSVSPMALWGFLIGWGSGARPVWCRWVGGRFWPEGPRQAELTSLGSRCQDGVVEGKMRSRLLCALFSLAVIITNMPHMPAFCLEMWFNFVIRYSCNDFNHKIKHLNDVISHQTSTI